MKICLGDAVSVRSGFTVRRGSKTGMGVEFRLVQIRNVSEDGHLRFDNPSVIKLADLPKDHLLVRGDVLMVAKGSNPRAAVFAQDERPTVAASQFFILRPHEGIRPEFLSCFLNQPETLRFFETNSAGSGIPFLPKETLLKLRIPIPSLEIQKRIVRVYELGIQEQELLERIREKRRQLVELSLDHILRSDNDDKPSEQQMR